MIFYFLVAFDVVVIEAYYQISSHYAHNVFNEYPEDWGGVVFPFGFSPNQATSCLVVPRRYAESVNQTTEQIERQIA